MKETKYTGTQTEKNLMAAFAGESEARHKYTYFAVSYTHLSMSGCPATMTTPGIAIPS